MLNKMSILVVVCMVVFSGVAVADDSLMQQCATKLTAVMPCLGFASGKEATPQQKCCDSVKDMKDSNPACLCFMILQIHNGTNSALKGMNIQEGRLLQLSSACKIANASISDCPKVLKLRPGSPDAAIFTSNATIVPPSSTTDTHLSGSHAVKYNAHGILQCTWISLAILLVLSLTSVFYV